MKKNLLIVLSFLILTSCTSVCFAKTSVNAELADAIKMYKAGNYSQCYDKIGEVISKDASNALAYYYRAISAAQIGYKNEAIENYEKAINLSPANNNLSRYAQKGKLCLESPDKCSDSYYENSLEEFILDRKAPKFTEQVRGEFEKLKIENMMREMNRSNDIKMEKFKEYKDFSAIPNDEEIVAAIRTLQKAGLGNIIGTGYSDVSVLTGTGNQNPMLNLMGGQNLNPQLIQTFLTNSMTQGF